MKICCILAKQKYCLYQRLLRNILLTINTFINE